MNVNDRLSIGEMFALIGKEPPEEFRALPFPGHVATDSRDVQTGSLFVALEGEKTDGHRYIPQAVERGAGLIVLRCGKRPEGLSIPCVELMAPEQELAKLASAYLKKLNLNEVLAVTGSVGKTTARTALQQVLSKRFKTHAAERSLNTRIGCTATVLATPLDAELLLMEFGANKPKEIAELTKLFPPTSALITQVAPVHLEGFGSIEGVLEGKMEIADSPQLRQFVYNCDNPLLRDAAQALRPSVKAFGVGRSEGADFQIAAPQFKMLEGVPTLAFKLSNKSGEAAVINANVWGEHIAYPLAFAAAMGNLLGMPLEECAEALRDFKSLPGRGRVLSLEGGRFLVDDAYNANPASMRASLETFLSLPDLKAEGKMVVLGEMREMGPEGPSYHKELEPLLDRCERAVLVGGIWRDVLPDHPGRAFVPNWEAALEVVNATSWEALLVKGSLSVGLPNLVQALCGGPK